MWDSYEVDLARSSLVIPWVSATLTYFYRVFILFFMFLFVPFWLSCRASHFVLLASFLLLFLVAICLEVEN